MRTSETIVVNPRPVEPAPTGFRIQDIYYVLFRHKWKIIVLTLLGLAAGAFAFFTLKPTYISQAQIFVRFIESKGGLKEEGTSFKSPDTRGDTILGSELAMIRSTDLAKEVVAQVGATNIVPGPVDERTTARAVSMVKGGLVAEPSKRTSVIVIQYTHPDPVVAQLVASNVVTAYERMHLKVHTSSDILADASRQVELRRKSLNDIEDELRRLKGELRIDSLDDARRALNEQMNRVSGEILAAEALLAEQRATVGIATNDVTASATNLVSSVPTNTIPVAKLTEYRGVLAQIDKLIQRENAFLESYTPESTFVIAVRQSIADAERRRQRLEEENPGIATYYAALTTPAARGSAQSAPGVPVNPAMTAMVAIRAQEAKLNTLREQLAQMQSNSVRISESAGAITELQRRREIEEQGYTYHYRVLEQARVDDNLNRDKVRGLSVVEAATPAYADRARILRLSGGLGAGGFILGILLAALLEFYVDGSIRRPVHVERSLRLPLFLSIPRLRQKRVAGGGLAPEGSAKALLDGPSGPGAGAVATIQGNGDEESMATYAEALRDRLMMYFQLHGLNHKPKLVGVTSCGHGAGVTSLATSLAASLSETGDGNVLYVDVNPRGPKVRGFQHGKPRIGLRDALENDTRETARVQDNLYMVSLADPATGKVGVIPKTLSGLVPKLKASDYDYIIFDLPPITQTSATAKVAGLLDMTFVVLESEKTLGDLARKATDLLGESRANVAAVLNKHRRYLPRSVDTDL